MSGKKPQIATFGQFRKLEREREEHERRARVLQKAPIPEPVAAPETPSLASAPGANLTPGAIASPGDKLSPGVKRSPGDTLSPGADASPGDKVTGYPLTLAPGANV